MCKQVNYIVVIFVISYNSLNFADVQNNIYHNMYTPLSQRCNMFLYILNKKNTYSATAVFIRRIVLNGTLCRADRLSESRFLVHHPDGVSQQRRKILRLACNDVSVYIMFYCAVLLRLAPCETQDFASLLWHDAILFVLSL